jgi:hypothetical protein
MGKADDLKAEYEVAVKVADLEDELVALKAKRDEGDKEPARLRAVKDELREWRTVLRLGRPAPDGSHNGFNIVDGQLVEKEG